MAYLNPDYDPDASKKLDEHFYNTQRIREERRNIIIKDDIEKSYREEQKEVASSFSYHNSIDKTILGYAKRILDGITSVIEESKFCVEKPLINYDTINSIDEVKKIDANLWKYLERSRRYAKHDLPIGQPENLNAFFDQEAAGFSRSDVVISCEDIASVGRYPVSSRENFTVVQDIRPDGTHICVGPCPDENEDICNGVLDAAIITLFKRVVPDIPTQPIQSARLLGLRLPWKAVEKRRSEEKFVFFYKYSIFIRDDDSSWPLPERFGRVNIRIANYCYDVVPEVEYQMVPLALKQPYRPKLPAMP